MTETTSFVKFERQG